MNFRTALEYYRDLRPNKLRTPKYRHLIMLLYWPVYGLAFLALERILPSAWQALTGNPFVYHPVVCDFDAMIPFCEWFVIPYYFWFAFIGGIMVYGLLFEIQVFREFMWWVIVTYTATVLIYLIYPTMQELRPAEFARDNLLTDIVGFLYNFDTHTNVCPSIHVLGSIAVCIPGLRSHKLRGWGWKTFFIVSTVLISVSTVFLKQHSVIDILVALVLGAVCYPLIYGVICKKVKEPPTAV